MKAWKFIKMVTNVIDAKIIDATLLTQTQSQAHSIQKNNTSPKGKSISDSSQTKIGTQSDPEIDSLCGHVTFVKQTYSVWRLEEIMSVKCTHSRQWINSLWRGKESSTKTFYHIQCSLSSHSCGTSIKTNALGPAMWILAY